MRRLAVLAALGVLTTGAAEGATHQWDFGLSGAEQVPAVATAGSGSATVTYNDVTNLLGWNVTFANLTRPAILAHFHGNAAPGVNAGVQVDIGAISGVTSPMIGSTTITDTQETGLLGGLWYINVHTSQWPNGEIRGQVVPEPSSLALLVLAGLAGLRRR